mgnify:CR=1 FL=1
MSAITRIHSGRCILAACVCVLAWSGVARAADVGRMVLVHLDPSSSDEDPIGLDVARAIFPRTELGDDLMELEF